MVRYLLENYPDADFVSMTDEHGNTPLHSFSLGARMHGHDELEVARLLFENGAQVNVINNRGRSPFHEVFGCGNVAIIQEFIRN